MKKFWKLGIYFKGYYLNYDSIYIDFAEYMFLGISLIYIIPSLVISFILTIVGIIIPYVKLSNDFFQLNLDLDILYYIYNVQLNLLFRLTVLFFNFNNPLLYIAGFSLFIGYTRAITKRDDKNSK